MGWSRGSTLMSAVIAALADTKLSKEKRKEFYLQVIPIFERHDWDTQDECRGEDPAFDEAAEELGTFEDET